MDEGEHYTIEYNATHLIFAVGSSSAVAAAATTPISESTQQDRRGELHGEVVGMKELYG